MAAYPDFAAAVSRILFVGRNPNIELVSAKLTHGLYRKTRMRWRVRLMMSFLPGIQGPGMTRDDDMNKKLFKHLMSAASVAVFAGYGSFASAHTQTGSLGNDAGAADIYQVTCATNDTTTGRLEITVLNSTASSPLLNVLIEKDGQSSSATDPVSGDKGDSAHSPLASVTAGDGPYTVTLTKAGVGTVSYSMDAHCKTGSGQHTGDDTSIVILQNDGNTNGGGGTTTGEVFKLNSSGTQYCSGKPSTFNASRDVDLWLRIDNDTQMTVYKDSGLTVPVFTFDVTVDSINSKSASFDAFYYGDADKHFEAIGVLKFNKDGSAKSLKASFLRKGILDSCYAKGTLTGKRVN
jgi:hypothetical protein